MKKKDLNGILEDGILSSLPESAKAMHDHNIVNYNTQFSFQNIECNIHLERDLQKLADDTGHTVLLSIKELIAQTIHERNYLRKTLGNSRRNTSKNLIPILANFWNKLPLFQKEP